MAQELHPGSGGPDPGRGCRADPAAGSGGRIVYFYVVDREQRLQGVLPIRRVLLNPPETPVAEVMVRNVVALPATATLVDACEQFILHRFLALPIVDDHRRILGVVDVELYTDEISDLARREESDDVFQLIGVRLAEVQQASPLAAFRRRFPWLLCNVAGGLACHTGLAVRGRAGRGHRVVALHPGRTERGGECGHPDAESRACRPITATGSLGRDAAGLSP